MKFFKPEELKLISTAVKKAEKSTTGEIVPLISTAADDYLAGAVFFCLITVALFTILYLYQGYWQSQRYLVLGQVLTILLSLLMLRLFPRIKLLFISPKMIAQTTKKRALQEFYEHRLCRTQKHTGILLALFLLEKRVEVIADEGINRKCKQATWDEVVRIIVAEAKRGKIILGFQKGIDRCGELLKKHFPAGKINRNELKNNLIIENN